MEKRFSGQVGKEYQLFQLAVPHHERLQNIVKEVLSNHFNDRLGGTVVEIGTGNGYTLSKVLDAHPKIKVIAIDNESTTLSQAEEAFSDQRERIFFRLEDALRVVSGLSDNSVDAVASAYTIHNLHPEYRSNLFREIARVLKKDGVFVNADKYAYDDAEKQKAALKTQLEAFSVYDERGADGLRREWTQHYIEDEKIKFTESEQVKLFNSHGLTSGKKIFREGMEAVYVAYN